MSARQRIFSLCAGALRLFKRYLGAAPWPNATCAASAVVGAVLLEAAFELWEATRLCGGLLFLVCLGWIGLSVLCQADALGRYGEYLRLKAVFLRKGACPRVLRLVSGSRCQRDAALFAAREAGCGEEAAAFYRAMGYRWRHLLPDAIMRNPLFFFNPAFLRATFFSGVRRRNYSLRQTEQAR